MIKTTVVIPNYNGEKYIKNCIESLLSSSVELKIVVVDNGSKDASVKIIETQFPMVEVIKLDTNTGFCNAVNVGIKNSKTPYVFLFNNDATVFKDTIEVLERDLDKYPKVFSVQAKMLSMSEPDKIDTAGDEYCALGWAYAIGKDKHSIDYAGINPVFSSCAGAALYRRATFKKLGLFDNNHFAYLEDVDIGYRANIFGYRNIADMNAKVLHAGSGSTGSRHNEFKVRISARNSIYLAYKNMPLLQLAINIPFLMAGVMIKQLYFIKKGLGRSYFEGIFEGISFCFSREARRHKISYKPERLSTYIALEVVLLANVFKRPFA